MVVSASSQRAVRTGEGEQRHLAIAQSHTRTVVGGGFPQAIEPHVAQAIQQSIDAHFFGGRDRGDVQRSRQGLSQTHGTMELSVVVARREISRGGREVQVDIGQHGRRREA
jgi:hypothetical protein